MKIPANLDLVRFTGFGRGLGVPTPRGFVRAEPLPGDHQAYAVREGYRLARCPGDHGFDRGCDRCLPFHGAIALCASWRSHRVPVVFGWHGCDLAESAALAWRSRFPIHQCGKNLCQGVFDCAGCKRVVGYCFGCSDELGAEHCDDCWRGRWSVLHRIDSGRRTPSMFEAAVNQQHFAETIRSRQAPRMLFGTPVKSLFTTFDGDNCTFEFDYGDADFMGTVAATIEAEYFGDEAESEIAKLERRIAVLELRAAADRLAMSPRLVPVAEGGTEKEGQS